MEYYNESKDEKEAKIRAQKKNQIILGNRIQRPPKTKEEGKLASKYYKYENNINTTYIYHNNKIKYFKNKKILLNKNKFYINLSLYFSIFKLYILIFINYLINSYGLCKRNLLFKLSEITLKINDAGNIKILSDNFFRLYNSCSIYINNIQNEIKNEYNFQYENNNNISIVRIVWDIGISNTESMFSGCNKIIEIDLSKFYTLNVTSMNNMFNGCSSLISLNLSNINTSEVTMMKAMFCECPSLISLDLSSFDTSKVSVIAGMFAEFPNLEYVNFKLIKLKQNVITENIFYETNNKIIVCIENEENTLLYLLNKKIDIHCNNYNSYNENIKKCYNKESIINNKYICDICGNNYVLKNATKINNQYAICFGVTEGYYLDENDLTYKPCYNSCKICETSGDNNTNNCLECKENHYELNILNSNYKNCYINNTFEESDKSGYKIESTLFNNDGIHS